MASILKNPVFIDGGNYSGSPSMLKTPLLKELIQDYFVKEICIKLKNPLFISLSPKVTEALEWLASQKIISENQVLSGIPHLSGANAERIAYFLGNKSRDQLSIKTNPDSIDKGKRELLLKNSDSLVSLVGRTETVSSRTSLYFSTYSKSKFGQ